MNERNWLLITNEPVDVENKYLKFKTPEKKAIVLKESIKFTSK